MSDALAITALCVLPPAEFTGVADDSVDRVEVNHFYDDEGRHIFDQLIFSDWDTQANRFQVRAWRLLKSTTQLPTRNFITGRYDVLWHDGEVTRRVEARSYVET